LGTTSRSGSYAGIREALYTYAVSVCIGGGVKPFGFLADDAVIRMNVVVTFHSRSSIEKIGFYAEHQKPGSRPLLERKKEWSSA